MLTHAPPPHTGRAYMSWLSTQPCLTCGVYGVELHHLSMWGLPRKTNNPLRDWVVVPLCSTCHQHGKTAAHHCGPWDDQGNHGQASWARLHALDLETTLCRQYAAYAQHAWLALPPGLPARQAAVWLKAAEVTVAPR